ncbi:MAG: CRISPR-associated helicase Cas3' [Tissierellia bacterium]|nr:CRISPR-associated helicase Cas3' [Tissierellia bacterium]
METPLADYYSKLLAKPQESIQDHTQRVLENYEILRDLAYIKDPDLLDCLRLACYYHDSGKINPHFQDRLKNGGRFNETREVGHNILSAHLVALFIEEETQEKKDLITNAILNHHHYRGNYDILYDQRDLVEENLRTINEDLLKIDPDRYEQKVIKALKSRRLGRLNRLQSKGTYIILKGLLNKCDYSASAHLPCEVENDFLKEALEGLPYQWNDMQTFCQDHQDKNLIIRASTGLGKTEGSLLWAGNRKIFYVLPLRTALNAMYSRIRDLVPQDREDRVGLLHGESLGVYLKEGALTQETAQLENEKLVGYYKRTKNLSLPVTVATPDQLFDFVFKYEGYEIKPATFSYASFIIDEIQAYSPDILAYTLEAIKRLHRLGSRFAIFTATLAPFVRDLLVDDQLAQSLVEGDYLSPLKRHRIRVLEEAISAKKILETLKDQPGLSSGLVICNTVKGAQALYQDLKEGLDPEAYDLQLLHAKFIGKDRQKKEEKILEDGQADKKREKTTLWVTTQIVEASLDIDFDILFTELSELLGLFQRLGRCHRKRPVREGFFNVHIFTKIEDKLLSKDLGFIDRGLYNLSREALRAQGDGLITEKDKADLIKDYLTTEKLRAQGESNFLDLYEKKIDYIRSLGIGIKDKAEVQREFRNIISFKAIPAALYYQNPHIPPLLQEIHRLETQIKEARTKETSKEDLLALRKDLFMKKNDLDQYTLSLEGYRRGKESFFVAGEEIYITPYAYTEELGLGWDREEEGLML